MHIKKKHHTEILLFLYQLKNSSFFSACVEKAGFPKSLTG